MSTDNRRTFRRLIRSYCEFICNSSCSFNFLGGGRRYGVNLFLKLSHVKSYTSIEICFCHHPLAVHHNTQSCTRGWSFFHFRRICDEPIAIQAGLPRHPAETRKPGVTKMRVEKKMESRGGRLRKNVSKPLISFEDITIQRCREYQRRLPPTHSPPLPP